MKKLLKLRDEMKEDLLHADGSVEDGTKMTYGPISVRWKMKFQRPA